MFLAARRFILKQRIEELKNALRHYPDSPRREDREMELREKTQELDKLGDK